MKINQIVVGALTVNCYIISTDKNNAVIIDAGAEANSIIKFVEENKLIVKAIVLTHGHFDHIWAVKAIKDKTGAKIYIHTSDGEMMTDSVKNLAAMFEDTEIFAGVEADVLLNDGDIIEVDEVKLKLMHTPGHSKGSSVYIMDDIIFSGDTLFNGGSGRTDFYGGNIQILTNSLENLAALEGDYTVLSGHGEQTTLNYERRTNPYMGKSYDDIF